MPVVSEAIPAPILQIQGRTYEERREEWDRAGQESVKE